ncbi:MAG: response regulator [Candidatus Nealsonbacteria bacterium CG10_big_fil_rev_8_21_14_0_10_40_24]|nr:MAG: response regulator [Candidatus Nealsonbacteria bacterium CG10_big_fil_rev_8_21_14_0_10_40_24]
MGKPRKKILIIEDDTVLQEMYSDRLKKEGFEVITASEGETGTQKAMGEHPDLILLDLLLPKKGGLGVLEVLKSWPKTSGIPVIVLTALVNEDYQKKAMRLGAVAHIIKPQTMPGQVVAKIKEVLGLNK